MALWSTGTPGEPSRIKDDFWLVQLDLGDKVHIQTLKMFIYIRIPSSKSKTKSFFYKIYLENQTKSERFSRNLGIPTHNSPFLPKIKSFL